MNMRTKPYLRVANICDLEAAITTVMEDLDLPTHTLTEIMEGWDNMLAAHNMCQEDWDNMPEAKLNALM